LVSVNAINLRPDAYIYNLLDIGHNFGIEVDMGKAVFGKVLKYDEVPSVFVNQYAALPTRTSVVAFAGGDASAWNQWVNANGADLFRETETNYILQCHVGIWPDPLRLWRQYPAGQTRGQLSQISVEVPAVIGTRGYINGGPTWGSPYDMPSRRSEILIPKEMPIEHMIFNPTRVTVMPQMIIHMRRCYVRWYDERIAKDKQVIESFANFLLNNKGDPVHYWSPGTLPYDYGALQELYVPPNDIRAMAGVKK